MFGGMVNLMTLKHSSAKQYRGLVQTSDADVIAKTDQAFLFCDWHGSTRLTSRGKRRQSAGLRAGYKTKRPVKALFVMCLVEKVAGEKSLRRAAMQRYYISASF